MPAADMPETLFADITRNDASEARRVESMWEFLDRVDDPMFDRVRRLMNDWFSRYPRAKRYGLRRRIVKGRVDQFHSAWFELYLHELHLRLGFDVTVEPKVAGVSDEPDFLLNRGASEHLLEATIVGGALDSGRERLIAAVVDGVSRVETIDFDLWFEIEVEGDHSPSVRAIRSRVTDWLETLDWSEERAKQESIASSAELPVHREAVGGWEFSFRAWARPPERRGILESALKVDPLRGGFFDHGGTLLDRLNRKAKQCEQHGVPAIIAVRVDGMGASDEDVRVALMGPAIGRLDPSVNPPRVVETGRHGKGVFRNPSGEWRNRHVLGVLVWDAELRPWSITRRQPTLWRHPNPSADLPRLPWRQVRLTGGNPEIVAGTFDPGTIFDLPDQDQFDDPTRWPGQPFARADQ